MKRFTLLLLLMLPGPLLAQPTGYHPNGSQSYHGDSAEYIARQRRSTRESAVEHAGNVARPLVESEFGDEGANALLKCSKEAATRLAECYASGAFAKIPRFKELLSVFKQSKSTDEIANWICDHPKELESDGAVTEFLKDPMTYVLSLKKLSSAERIEVKKESIPKIDEDKLKGIACLALVIGVPVLIWRWYRRRAAASSAA